jgi:microcystin-dependent protein
MASSYPGALDSSFPGYPYVDNTEYILSSYANSWILAIQAIQSAIGYGSGSIAANPLYSVAYNTLFATITARLSHVESAAINAVGIDESASDIQPVGPTAIAGGLGIAADAKHVHVGVRSFMGRTGVVTTQASDFGGLFTAAGGLLVGTGNGTSEILPAGGAGSVLTVGGGDASGLQWATASVAGVFSPGDFKFTGAIVVQTGWLAANAQAVSRSTYAALMSATTLTFTGTASGSTISGLSSATTQYLVAGMSIEGPSLGSSATITGVSTNSITVSSSPSAGGQTFTVFPNGNGNGSTTFNVADMRGKVPVGTGGTGSNASPTYAFGQTTGEQTHTLVINEEPSHNHTASAATGAGSAHAHGVSDPSHLHYATPGYAVAVAAGSTFGFAVPGLANSTFIDTNTAPAVTGIAIQGEASHNHPLSLTTASTGGGNSHNNMQPSYAGQWLIKT